MDIVNKSNQKISPIIQAEDLLELYKDDQFVLIDASNGKNAAENYFKKHLDQALFVNLNTQLFSIKEDAKNGGRHPLPTIDEFIIVLNKLGISEESHVVIYDDKNGANAAARFWWMLKAIGHEKVQVLNGGIQQAEKIGLPTNHTIAQAKKVKPYEASHWKLPLADIVEVEQHSENKDYLVIDVRAAKRYRGEFEPIDLIAGHIPGSINVPLATNLNEEGLFLSQNQLKEKYQKLFKQTNSENIIVHCGSGVTACHTLLAMDYAGLEIPKLYIGSWSEWSRNNKKIVKEA